MPPSVLAIQAAAQAAPPDSRRIRREILMLFVILALLSAGVALRSTLTERADRLEDAQARSLHLARGLEQHTSRLINGASQYLIDMRNVIEEAGSLDAISPRRLDRFLAGQLRDGAIRRVLIVDADGNRWNGAAAEESVSFAARPWFNYHRNKADREVRISKPVRSLLDGKWVVPISTRIDRPDGSFGGTVVTGLSADHLLEFYQSLGVVDDSSIALVGEDGTIFMRHPRFEEAMNRTARPSSLDRMTGQEGTFEAVSQFDEKARIVSYRRVAGHPLYVVVGLSRDQVFGPWIQNTGLRALMTIAAIGALGLFCAVLLRRMEREMTAAAVLQHFKAAVDHSADLVFWVAPDGRFAYTNEAAARRMGYSRDAITRVTVPEVSPDLTRERFREFWDTLQKEGHLKFETTAVARDGTPFPIEISASHLPLNDTEVAFVIARDLTEEKLAEERVQALNATLEHRVRERTNELALANEDLESFGFSVSHDLRAPLRHLSGYAQILAEEHGHELPDSAKELVTRIGERARYMNALIDGLMQVARVSRDPLSPRDVDLSAIATAIVEDLRRAEPQREVKVDIDPQMRVHGDPILLRTLMQNLIGNAWKYTRKVPAAHIRVGGEAHGRFCVRDNGVGFDPRFAQRLFTPFQRLHSASEYEGTGVGLATARRIVERHGGSIQAESKPQEGASFCFTLPEASAAV